MAILVSDTATEVLAVGIGRTDDAHVDFSATAVVPRAHSRWLQPTLEHGLKVCGITPGDIQGIGVGVGPGSYTGVRLAVSTAKAMAMALNATLYPIPTLLTLAEAACSLRDKGVPLGSLKSDDACERIAMPLLNARRQRAFGAVYRSSPSGWHQVVPVQVQSLDAWSGVLKEQLGSSEAPFASEVHLVHDMTEDALVWMDEFNPVNAGSMVGMESQQSIFVHCLHDIGNLIPAAMLRLIAMSGVSGVVGEDIHAVVPEYALLVEAESKLAEGKSLAGDVH